MKDEEVGFGFMLGVIFRRRGRTYCIPGAVGFGVMDVRYFVFLMTVWYTVSHV